MVKDPSDANRARPPQAIGRAPSGGSEHSEREGSFLHRWSRRKHEAARVPQPPPAVDAPPVPAVAAAPAPAPGETPPLPPVESLTLASDFTPFFSAKVDETVKRAAMRKLFSDPHFNVMDGLDIYIDDYSQPDPMPPGMLDKLADIYKTVEEKVAEAPPTETTASAADTPKASAEPSPPPESEPMAEQDPDEHLG
jgi:hypothetical protein